MASRALDFIDQLKGDLIYRGDPSNLVTSFPDDYYYWDPDEMLGDSETVDIYCKRTDGQEFDLEDVDPLEAQHFYRSDRQLSGSFRITGKKLAVWLSDDELNYRYKSTMRKHNSTKSNKFVARGVLAEDVDRTP